MPARFIKQEGGADEAYKLKEPVQKLDRRSPVEGETVMSMESVILLPETVVTGLLGRDLPASVGQEFDYNGKRYKVRQRDPARSEGGVPCELVEPVAQEEKRRRRAKGRRF